MNMQERENEKTLPTEINIKGSSNILEIGCGARFTYKVDQN